MASANSLNFRSRPRISGFYTVFTYANAPLVWCQQVGHQSPQPVAAPAAVHPMDEPYPAAIITPVAAGPGQMVLNLIELFGSEGKVSKVWDRLGVQIPGATNTNPFGSTTSSNSSIFLNTGNPESGIFKNAADIVDIYIQQAKFKPEECNIIKYVRPLPTGNNSKTQPYFETYHECVITNVVDNEQVEIGSMEVVKQVSLMYRYVTRPGGANEGFKLRDSAY